MSNQQGSNRSRLFNNEVLVQLAPHLMSHRILNSPSFWNADVSSSSSPRRNPLAAIARNPRLLLPSARNRTATDLHIIQGIDRLLSLEVPSSSSALPGALTNEPHSTAESVSLLTGFNATIPSASDNRVKRRKKRAGIGEAQLGISELGLKERGDRARGMLTDSTGPSPADSSKSAPKRKRRLQGLRQSLDPNSPRPDLSSSASYPELSRAELEEEISEIMQDQRNIIVRRGLVNTDIEEIDAKIHKLEEIREEMRSRLLGLREEELELEDELEGVQERLANMEVTGKARVVSNSSRRRKGPAFLPSEHDEIPAGVAFMTLYGHSAPITSLDFTEPYGTLVSASHDETLRLWDLTNGEEVGRLKDCQGLVKCLQVENQLCVTGSRDGVIRLWDLDIALDEAEGPLPSAALASQDDDGPNSSIRSSSAPPPSEACMKRLEGHSKDVTCIYHEGNILVSGSTDKTLRQWDLVTGQCVMTMDILWAMANPVNVSMPSANLPPTVEGDSYFPSSTTTTPQKRINRSLSSNNYLLSRDYDPPLPALGGESWGESQDFVGGVQFWGYALASGTADGCVRMWDMRTGQSVRSLTGHTSAVTCLQYDEYHLISGSLDSSIRTWDLRTGRTIDARRYEAPVTALQFDSRKIIAASGENLVRVFNRTTLQETMLFTNGHTEPVEKLRFMDRYLATGSRDCTVKLWSLG